MDYQLKTRPSLGYILTRSRRDDQSKNWGCKGKCPLILISLTRPGMQFLVQGRGVYIVEGALLLLHEN